jgi:hypothetical protein
LPGQGGLSVQPKLTVNQPGDRYEQEADRVAEAVMRVPGPLSQRRVEPEENEGIRANPLIGRASVQRRVEGDEEMPRSSAAAPSRRGGGEPLAPPVRSFMETRFGHDFGRVRVHTDARADEAARALDARAYTQGRDVVFASGRYDPHSYAGRKLLAHELVHVIQQGASSATRIQRQTSYGTPGPNPRAIREPEDRKTILIPPAGETPEIQRQEAYTSTVLESEPPGARQTADGGLGSPVPMQATPPATAPTLSLTPRLTRGGTLTAAVNFTPGGGETLNVAAWRYVTPAHGTVTRPTSDSGFQRQWSGVMALSGTLEMDYAATPAGGTVGAATTLRQDVTVDDRTGAPWAASSASESEESLGDQPSPPRQFPQLGRHNGNITNPVPTATPIASGPNSRFTFVGALTAGSYISKPRIHPDLSDTSSRFHKFHLDPSRLYLVVGRTRTLVPVAQYSNLSVSGGALTFDVPDWEAFYKTHNFYSVTANDGAGGPEVPLRNAWWGLDSNAANANLVSRNDAAIRGALGIPSTRGFSMGWQSRGSWEGFQLMQAPGILTGTRSHEYQHAQHSHRANFLAMVRALDPQRKIESTVSTPTQTVDFNSKIGTWVAEILKPNHELVDEPGSRAQEKFVSLPGVTMAGVNTDPATGNFLGSVWDITGDKQMT